MQKDLSIPGNIVSTFPQLAEELKKAQDMLQSIRTWDDIEDTFLRARGLSPQTYNSYSTSAKQFFDFTGGLHPFQVRPAHIERWFDDMVKRIDRNSAVLRIRGLTAFFRGIEEEVLFFTSPFKVMSKILLRKLNKGRKGNRKKKALAKGEFRGLLKWLKGQATNKSRCNYAIVYMLGSSGLRAAELLQLRWKDLSFFEGSWTAQFIGKGDKDAEQELYTGAVEAALDYFRKQFKREPVPEDKLFWTIPGFAGDQLRPMEYQTLYRRIVNIGKAARENGIIKREMVFSPHLLRRTYATLLYREGMGIKGIQEKTRHASVDTLMKYYVKDDDPSTPYLTRALEGAMA